MSYHSMTITELPEDSDDDFALEFKTSEAMFGISMSTEEAMAVGQSLLDSAKGDMDSFDGQHADEVAEEVR